MDETVQSLLKQVIKFDKNIAQSEPKPPVTINLTKQKLPNPYEVVTTESPVQLIQNVVASHEARPLNLVWNKYGHVGNHVGTVGPKLVYSAQRDYIEIRDPDKQVQRV
jgi:predicted short-subunit dehydrogenase-like oxidoreductase (DUF2520 family)